ncbi:hypothetical protein, partial [Escherichia coli]|uniref:hypothetical protein n=1 Tax=Escherichia coli TaxID=562 RepID=UPI003F667454
MTIAVIKSRIRKSIKRFDVNMTFIIFPGYFPYLTGFAPIFPDTCHHLTHYWPAAVDIPVASDNPVH